MIINNIGYETTRPQIRKEIFSYIKDYAGDVSKEPVKIYVRNQFNKLDVSDLSEPKRGLFKILGDTNELKSYLDATIAKDRFERYTTIDYSKDYLMEMREII